MSGHAGNRQSTRADDKIQRKRNTTAGESPPPRNVLAPFAARRVSSKSHPPSLDGVRVVVGHGVQQGDRLVRVHRDKNVPRVRVDVVVGEPGVEKAQERGLVEAVQLRRVLAKKNARVGTKCGKSRAFFECVNNQTHA